MKTFCQAKSGYITIVIILVFMTLGWVQNNRIRSLRSELSACMKARTVPVKPASLNHPTSMVLNKGEKEDFGQYYPDGMDIINTRDSKSSRVNFDDGQTYFLFLFERPCSPCNRNVSVWNKLFHVLNNFENVKVLGLVDHFSKENDKNLAHRVAFPVYQPVDVDIFLQIFRRHGDMSQTIVIQGGQIQKKLFGDIQADAMKEMIQIVKGQS